MRSAYPLSRCPACKKAFRMEIKPPVGSWLKMGQMACPHCGMKFQRFDPQYLKESPLRPVAR